MLAKAFMASANVNQIQIQTDASHRTALDIAVSSGNEGIINDLIQYGAKASIQTFERARGLENPWKMATVLNLLQSAT